ncbi:MAG TPA: hypothetical protein VEV19_10410 [Ktedonobacteraceae bacterium]|nr:hypothetical protein [Ktedonobacteraceae bacterium]
MEYRETTIQITFRHPVSHTEVLPDDADGTEIALESGFALPLAELYGGIGEVIIEKVTVETSPTVYSHEEAARYQIY